MRVKFPVCIEYRLVCFVSVDVVFYLGIFLFLLLSSSAEGTERYSVRNGVIKF